MNCTLTKQVVGRPDQATNKKKKKGNKRTQSKTQPMKYLAIAAFIQCSAILEQ